jgi:hypothetical protein
MREGPARASLLDRPKGGTRGYAMVRIVSCGPTARCASPSRRPITIRTIAVTFVGDARAARGKGATTSARISRFSRRLGSQS